MTILRSILHRLLRLYFGVGDVPKSFEAIAAAPEKHIVITPGSSLVFDCMLDSFARRSGLKGARHCPAALGSSATTQILQEDGFLLWAGIDEENLIGRVFEADPKRLFSTLNTFRLRGPVKSRPHVQMSLWRQLGLILGFRFLIVIFGKAIDLSERSGSHPRHLARRLKVDFFQNLKLVRGMPFQTMETQVRSILAGTEYQRDLRIIAQRMNCSEGEAHRKARRAFFELAANPTPWMFLIARPVCRFFIKRLFSQVVTRGMDKLADAVQNNTVVMVPMHRSHMDYVLLGYELYKANLNPPMVAAGSNLSFWPFGYIFRSVGAYFVKRDARQDRLHALVLKRYVAYLIKRGHLQEFFIEGGRSRSGRMVHPKLGIISTIISAYRQGFRKDVLFLPVSITYEKVVEDSAFGEENTGQSKKKENLLALVRAWRVFRHKYGEVIIKFGEPISLRKFSQERAAALNGAEDRPIASSLAQELTASIQNQCDVSLVSLAACALMTTPSYGLMRKELASSIRALARTADLVSSALGLEPGRTSALESFLGGRDDVLEDLGHCGFINRAPCLRSEAFFIPGDRRFTADFYRNASSHLFLTPALFSLSELMHGEILTKDLSNWHEILGQAFQLSSLENFLNSAEKVLEALKLAGLVHLRDGKQVFSTHSEGVFIPGMLQSSIEALLWIYRNLQISFEGGDSQSDGGEQSGEKPSPSCSYNELLSRLLGNFKTSIYLGGYSRTEAASHATLSLFLESLRSRRIVSFDEKPSAKSSISLLKDDSPNIEFLHNAAQAVNRWSSERRLFNGETI